MLLLRDTNLRTHAKMSICCGTYEVCSISAESELRQVRKALSLRLLSSTVDPNHKRCIVGTAHPSGSAFTNSALLY